MIINWIEVEGGRLAVETGSLLGSLGERQCLQLKGNINEKELFYQRRQRVSFW